VKLCCGECAPARVWMHNKLDANKGGVMGSKKTVSQPDNYCMEVE